MNRLFIRIVAAAALVLLAAAAQAMTRQDVQKTCPYDGTVFTFSEQMSGTTFDKALDFMEIGAIEVPLPLAVCPTNGFIFIKPDYAPDELERLRPLIFSAEFQALKGEAVYYRAAWIMERQGAPHETVTNYLLQATWEAGRQELSERASAANNSKPFKELMAEGTVSERYVRYATELLARLPADIQAMPKPQSTSSRLLTGELLRRIGRFEDADEHFRTIDDLKAGSGEARYVDFQRQLIAKRDRGVWFVSDFLKRR